MRHVVIWVPSFLDESGFRVLRSLDGLGLRVPISLGELGLGFSLYKDIHSRKLTAKW